MQRMQRMQKKVSTSAKTCPHYGVKNPGFGAKQKLSGCLILIIIVGIVMYFVGNSDDDKAIEATKVCSNTDTQCNFDKNLEDAVTICKLFREV